jgi:3-oxoadipate enol-lactonase
MEVRGDYVDIDGDRLFYEVAGSGPALVFLHAGIADRRMWDAEFERFSHDHFVARFDARGFGHSSPHTRPFLRSGDTVAVMDTAGINRAVLIGCSLGGRVALDVCVTSPERVSGLVLIASAMRDYEWSEEIRRYGDREDELFEAGELDELVEINLRTWVDGPQREPHEVDPAVRGRVAVMQRDSFEILLAAGDDLSDEDEINPPVAEGLSEVTVPTLVMWGDLDVRDISQIGACIAGAIPDAAVELVKGAAHLPNLEAPQRVDDAIADFLAAHGL